MRRRLSVFFFNDTATTEIYTLSLHDALPISGGDAIHERPHDCAVGVDERGRCQVVRARRTGIGERLRLDVRGGHVRIRSEEHTSELPSRQYPVCRLLL